MTAGWIKKAIAEPRTNAPRKSKQEEDHDGHDQSPHAERDLQVATAPLRIENP